MELVFCILLFILLVISIIFYINTAICFKTLKRMVRENKRINFYDQNYFYLDKLNVPVEDQYTNWMKTTLFDKRESEWEQQRNKYGIDERETWNWSTDYMDYIYIHLKLFNETNIVNFNKETIEYRGKELTVQSVIDEILTWFETRYYPGKDDNINIMSYPTEEKWKKEIIKWNKERQHILDLFAKIITHLNW